MQYYTQRPIVAKKAVKLEHVDVGRQWVETQDGSKMLFEPISTVEQGDYIVLSDSKTVAIPSSLFEYAFTPVETDPLYKALTCAAEAMKNVEIVMESEDFKQRSETQREMLRSALIELWSAAQNLVLLKGGM